MSSTGDPSSPSPRVYLLTMVIVIAVILAGVGVANRALNPLVYDPSSLRSVAQDMAAGRNYANYDPNINWRQLRKEQISLMTSTPDVIVFGGSRWQEAHAALMPGSTMFDAWVSNDTAEDAMAIVYLLDKAHRLPKPLVLSLRYISFQPAGQRDTPEWQEWAPEYRAMAAQLGIAADPYLQTLPTRRWEGLFNSPSLFTRTQEMAAVPDSPHATTDTQTPGLDILSADGSLLWSGKSQAKFTKAYTDKDVRTQLAAQAGTAPAIDPKLVDAMGTTIGFLRSKGVHVVIAQTPYHPDFYAGIQGRPFAGTLVKIEQIAQGWRAQYGVDIVGGFDPARIGCSRAEYIDYIHSRASCLAKVLRQVADLPQGA